MKLLLILAWRNLWRNKRRTGITLASVFFAVILCTLMMSMKNGMYGRMMDTMVGSFSGYVQIQHKDYFEDRTLDNGFILTDSILRPITDNHSIKGYAPRIESFALSASDELTKGALVVGIDCELEKAHSAMHERIDTGEYLSNDDSAVMLGSGLADYLRVKVGDTIVLIGQGFQGSSAAGRYPIKGLLKFGSPEISKQLIVMPLREASFLYSMEDRITNLIVVSKDMEHSSGITDKLNTQIPSDLKALHWTSMAPELVNMIEADTMEGYVFMFILYTIIAFGIFGTVLMMLAERNRELGVMVALGMKRRFLAILVWLEVVLISLLGAVIGMAGAFPVCLYFYLNPIRMGGDSEKMFEEYGMEPVIQSSIEPGVFLQQASIVALVACVIAIYPLIKITGLKAMNAMRS